MKRLVLAVLLALPLPALAVEDAGTGIIYGKQHSFSLTAPKGWVLDTKSGVADGVHAAFYPKGGTWKDSPVVMYGNGVDKTGAETFDQFVAGDVKKFENAHADIKVTDLDPGSVPGKAVKAKRFSFKTTNEVVVYIDEPKSISLIVMSARGEDKLIEAFPAFQDLVKSYQFMTSDVRVN